MKIKLVIWDLDETFWKGTLSEDDVTPIQNNIELVKLLSYHGIINSISSKNDFDKAKSKLVEMGIWYYFVFPVINWNPNGENVREIVHNCQLQNPNIVFIDDNPSNCREVEHYNEGITTYKSPDELVVNWNEYKDDPKLVRLNQYKILEKKLHLESHVPTIQNS